MSVNVNFRIECRLWEVNILLSTSTLSLLIKHYNRQNIDSRSFYFIMVGHFMITDPDEQETIILSMINVISILSSIIRSPQPYATTLSESNGCELAGVVCDQMFLGQMPTNLPTNNMMPWVLVFRLTIMLHMTLSSSSSET